MKILVIVIVAIVVLLGCCIGGGYFLFYFGTSMAGTVVRPQIEGTPAINTYIGQISALDFDFGETSLQAQSGANERLAFDVEGDKGKGLVIVEQGPQGINNAAWAILEMNGNSYIIFGNPPEELGAVAVPDTGATAPTEPNTPADTAVPDPPNVPEQPASAP